VWGWVETNDRVIHLFSFRFIDFCLFILFLGKLERKAEGDTRLPLSRIPGLVASRLLFRFFCYIPSPTFALFLSEQSFDSQRALSYFPFAHQREPSTNTSPPCRLFVVRQSRLGTHSTTRSGIPGFHLGEECVLEQLWGALNFAHST
jgi:hypothetical protein